jgi:NAD(P)-dependent dehydrogenase (short-subunit alcohol dehydrogenase family)
MIKSIAMENARFGITINNINLGYFNCGMIRDIPENLMPGLLKEIPMNRLGDPSEIVKCIDYIESAEYLTGACIDLDGGL